VSKKMGALGVHVSLCVDASVFASAVDWKLLKEIFFILPKNQD
jgi:hypothetical protein